MRTLSLNNTSDNIRTISLLDGNEDPKEEHRTISLTDLGNIDTVKNEGSINYFDLDKIYEEYGRDLTKEDIINDERLMDIVRTSLEGRYAPGGLLTKGKRVAVGLAGGDIGGLSGRDYRNMDAEKAFEIWQNYQRSFAGGQTVTTANEIAYTIGASDDIKMKLGSGYKLFDMMGNAITGAFKGESTFAEMGDALWDYTKAAVYDPSTLLSFGLGKVFGFGATKASGLAARTLMIKSYQDQIKKGVGKATAIKTISQAVKKALPFALADSVIGAGTDVAYQMQLIDVGVQEEFSKAQTAITAAGSMVVIPALVAGGATFKEIRKAIGSSPEKKGLISRNLQQILAYEEFDKNLLKMSVDDAEKLLKKRVKKETIKKYVDRNWGLSQKESRDFLTWHEIKEEASKNIKIRGEDLFEDETQQAFFRYFWLGDPDKGTQGFYEALKDAGFVVHKSMEEKYGTTTKIFSQAIRDFLDEDQAKQIIEKFEKDTGRQLKFYTKGVERPDGVIESKVIKDITPDTLADQFVKQTSTAGKKLWAVGHMAKLEKGLRNKKKKLNAKELTDIAAGKTDPKDDPKYFQFTLSTYKRLLTSHLSTTGANIKGFTQLVSINTAADLATAVINMGQSKIYKYLGNAEAAERYYNRAWGSAIGAIRRGFDVISPDVPMEYADLILEASPETMSKLFRDVAGDGGIQNSLETLNMDKAGKVWRGADAITKGAQTLTLVRLQDSITKRWAFGANVNQAIMREYGVTANQFLKRVDAGLEMASDRFKENVLEKALFRTQRETASVNWSTLPGKEGMFAARSWAKGIETATNRYALGFIVPFGSFMNTAVATMADYTGINTLRLAYRKATGLELDFATREGAEIVGKHAAGWALIGIGVYGGDVLTAAEGQGSGGALERVRNGLKFNQDLLPDGSVVDRKYDWPMSAIRLISQIIAHGITRDGKFDKSQIPMDLLGPQLIDQIIGQAVRDIDGITQSLSYSLKEASTGNFDPMLEMAGAGLQRSIQGFTRPLDPINTVVGFMRDREMNPDFTQAELGSTTRYINNLLPIEELPSRADPITGDQKTFDLGKQLLGTRMLGTPDVVERMINSVGAQSFFDVFRMTIPPKLRTKVNRVAAPFFEVAAIKYLNRHPNFFELPLDQRRRIVDQMTSEVKSNTRKFIKDGMPKAYDLIMLLDSKNKDKLKKVMNFLEIDQDLEDMLDDPDAVPTLLRIKALVDNYDDIFFGDLMLN